MTTDPSLPRTILRAARPGLALALALAGGCSLDFDALERGRRDGGTDMDARTLPPDARADAPGSDAWDDDAQIEGDAQAEDDAQVPEDAPGADAPAPVDAWMPDAPPGCPTPADCTLPACLGAACDDGLACTLGDVCRAGGTCGGTPRTCMTDGCSTQTCTEPAGTCVTVATAPEATLCPGGRCCFGRCSGLRDSGNCAGCGLGCDEETCSATLPASCICVTHAGCPSGQQCVGGRCRCSTNAQCAGGQTCDLGSGTCTY